MDTDNEIVCPDCGHGFVHHASVKCWCLVGKEICSCRNSYTDVAEKVIFRLTAERDEEKKRADDLAAELEIYRGLTKTLELNLGASNETIERLVLQFDKAFGETFGYPEV